MAMRRGRESRRKKRERRERERERERNRRGRKRKRHVGKAEEKGWRCIAIDRCQGGAAEEGR